MSLCKALALVGIAAVLVACGTSPGIRKGELPTGAVAGDSVLSP